MPFFPKYKSKIKKSDKLSYWSRKGIIYLKHVLIAFDFGQFGWFSFLFRT